MKNFKTSMLILVLAITAISFSSCDDDDQVIPIVNASTVEIRNTFQGINQTGGVEMKIEDLFGAPEGSLEATATVGAGIEFENYLVGLYDIDINENTIHFNMAAKTGDATYGELFRTIEAGSFDRYYLTFTDGHSVSSFTSNDAAVNLRIDSDKILVVEIGEGYVFQPGAEFTITLH